MNQTIETLKRPAPVAALLHGIMVLRALAEGQSWLGLREIARRTALHHSTVYRLLATLAEAGLVEYDSAIRQHRLGSGVINPAAPYLANLDVRQAALPFLQQLAMTAEESINLSIWTDGAVLNIEHVPGPDPVNAYQPVGCRSPAHCTAGGKVFLAYAVPEVVDATLARGLPRMTEHTIADSNELRAQLEAVRRTGYAVNEEELVPGVFSIAAPISDRRDDVVGAVVISAPTHRATPERREHFAHLVTQTARDFAPAGVCRADAIAKAGPLCTSTK